MPRRRARCFWLAAAAATAAVAAARPGSARHRGRAAGAAGAGQLAAADAAGATPPQRPLAATAHSAAGPTIDVDALVQHNLALQLRLAVVPHPVRHQGRHVQAAGLRRGRGCP